MAQQEHHEYIQQKVNPILENLVTQLLLERPEQLAPFMIKWLSQNSKAPASTVSNEGVSVLNELKGELDCLQEEVKDLEQQVAMKTGDTEGVQLQLGLNTSDAKKAKAEDDESEEEDEGEDDAEDVSPPPAAYLKRGPRASVSAEAYGNWNKPQDFSAPVYPKSDEQKRRLASVLKESFLFASLKPSDMDLVIGAMQERVVDKDTRLIEQGGDGDCLYVVEDGQMNCYIKQPDDTDKMVKECVAGDVFGELALLYNCPRKASVVAANRCVVWELDRESFTHIVKSATIKRREQFEAFLKLVPLLQSLQDYQRNSICDALQPVIFQKGEVIIKQGDPGDIFYILEEGSAAVTKVYVLGTPPQEVLKYGPGDYFGELALLNNEPRAATVTATEECRCYGLSRKTFTSLLGPLEEILQRNAKQYE